MNPYPCNKCTKANESQYCNGCPAYNEYINKLADKMKNCNCKNFKKIHKVNDGEYQETELEMCSNCGRLFLKRK